MLVKFTDAPEPMKCIKCGKEPIIKISMHDFFKIKDNPEIMDNKVSESYSKWIFMNDNEGYCPECSPYDKAVL